jgi:hypothetical protein
MRTNILKVLGRVVYAALLLSLPALAAAQGRNVIEVANLGPQIGDSVPPFSLRDQHGQNQTLDSIAGPNGTMLLFHRSADW